MFYAPCPVGMPTGHGHGLGWCRRGRQGFDGRARCRLRHRHRSHITRSGLLTHGGGGNAHAHARLLFHWQHAWRRNRRGACWGCQQGHEPLGAPGCVPRPHLRVLDGLACVLRALGHTPAGHSQCDGCGQWGEHQRAHTRDTGRTGQDGMLFVETVGLTAGERHGRPRTVHATIPVRVQFTGQLQPARRRSHQLTFMFRLHTHLFTLPMSGQQPLLHLTDLLIAFRLATGQALFDQGGHLLLACLGVFGTHLDQFLVLHFAGDNVPGGFVGGKLRHVARVRRQPVTRLPVDPLLVPIGVFDHQVVLDAVQMITLLPFQLAFERIVHHTGSIPVVSIGGADRPVRFRLLVRLGLCRPAPVPLPAPCCPCCPCWPCR